MAAIDLIVLGMIKQKAQSAYDIQKLVEYRHISEWVRISTPAIYKKVIQLEQKGFLLATVIQGETLLQKTKYSLTLEGEKEFARLMLEVAEEKIHFFLDFNAVIVNMASLAPAIQKDCISKIQSNIVELKQMLSTDIQTKKNMTDIPKEGFAVLQQQFMLTESIEKWIDSIKNSL